MRIAHITNVGRCRCSTPGCRDLLVKHAVSFDNSKEACVQRTKRGRCERWRGKAIGSRAQKCVMFVQNLSVYAKHMNGMHRKIIRTIIVMDWPVMNSDNVFEVGRYLRQYVRYICSQSLIVVAAILVFIGGKSSKNKLRSTLYFLCPVRAPLKCMHVEHNSNGIEEIKLLIILKSMSEIEPHGTALHGCAGCGTKKIERKLYPQENVGSYETPRRSWKFQRNYSRVLVNYFYNVQ